MLEIVPVDAFKDNSIDRPVSEGDTVSIPELGVAFSVLEIPGHTRAHIAIMGQVRSFCGDTPFPCGCGSWQSSSRPTSTSERGWPIL